MKGVKVSLVETNTNETHESITNEQGIAHFVITTGSKYSINFLDLKDHAFVEVPTNGNRTQTKTITYIPPEHRQAQQKFNRTGVAFKEERQNFNASTEPTKTHSILGLKIVDSDKRGLPGISLTLVSLDQKTKYKAITNRSGWAYFLVPKGQPYELDVPGIEAFKQYKLPTSPYSVIEYTHLYVPTKVAEKAKGDTILQEVAAKDQATTERIKMTVEVKDFDGNPLEGEAVFYDVQSSDEVYLAHTDRTGRAYFLLPKTETYMLNLTYERQIKPLYVDGKERSAIGQGSISLRYRGTEVIRQFYKGSKRNADGIVVEFMETPIEAGSVVQSYYEKTSEGYDLNFGSNSVVYAPVVINDRLYTSHGFYTNEFSCFDASSGEMLWTVELGEGGASPAAFDDDMLLMITESCSIYGIEAESGRLAWSKWLAPYVICSPSAHNGLVYAVYENDATEFIKSHNQYVLACFDLKTGDVKWQRWVDREGLSSPVVTDESVFLTTLSGSLYEFDAQTGAEKHKLDMGAASAPTISDDRILVARRDGEHGQSLCVIDRNTWRYNIVAAAGYYMPGSFDRMNDMLYLIPYEGGRPLIKDDLVYQTIDNTLYCRKLDGTEVWRKVLTTAPTEPGFAHSSMPVLVGKNIFVTTSAGILLALDAKSGKQLERFTVPGGTQSQPIVADGSIYVGSSNGELIVYQTRNRQYDGWPMWGGNPQHNTVID